MKIYDVTVGKANKSLRINLPKPEVKRINLFDKVGIQMWIGDNMIVAKPMLLFERQWKNTEMRNVNMSDEKARLILPQNLARAFNIKAGDKIRVCCRPDYEGREVFMKAQKAAPPREASARRRRDVRGGIRVERRRHRRRVGAA